MPTKTATHDKLIGRLPADKRRNILDALASSSRDHLVAIEHAWQRQLADADTTVGTILGVAYHPGGGADTVLIVRPADPSKRLVAIPAPHILRVRSAHEGGSDPRWRGKYLLGEVLAGPPIQRTTTTTTTEES